MGLPHMQIQYFRRRWPKNIKMSSFAENIFRYFLIAFNVITGYAIVMFILMLLNLIFFSLLIASRSKLEEGIETGLWMALNETENNEGLRKIVQNIFINNECCGVDSPEDLEGYENIACYTTKGHVVGCKEILEASIDRSFTAIKVISIITAIFQIMLIIASCYVCAWSKTENPKDTYIS
ncbi:23 kDa integral membrane protein isoform X3 [Octopus bimaculoides]|uniref:23 kDa integral membrane protein isoform X3 n=1 Tax=Octopus bimaculoides TaxID=37653 RepID=UPI0022DFF888|nr:23 kDa integral membrane protein isoform X3 [Octopus bimaculoides]